MEEEGCLTRSAGRKVPLRIPHSALRTPHLRSLPDSQNEIAQSGAFERSWSRMSAPRFAKKVRIDRQRGARRVLVRYLWNFGQAQPPGRDELGLGALQLLADTYMQGEMVFLLPEAWLEITASHTDCI